MEGIRGAAYDAMGVFGARAASVLAAAGVSPDRIAIVGAARLDYLMSAPSVRPTIRRASCWRGSTPVVA